MKNEEKLCPFAFSSGYYRGKNAKEVYVHFGANLLTDVQFLC